MISRRNTQKSYGGSVQTNLEIQKNILRKLQANLKWKNVRQFTKEQRAQLPQRVANQQRIVNDLQKLATTSEQNKGILASITNKINDAVTVIKNNIIKTSNAVNRTNQVLQQPSPIAAQQAIVAANQASIAANAMVNQTQNIKKMAMNVNTLAKNANILAKRIKSMSGGKRKTRRMHRTHHK
jgi:hypothetical protein